MARLESQMKMGYYPTPESVLERIFENVEVDRKRRIRVLDPCCGQGEALEFIKNKYGNVELYGIELDKDRYKITQEKIKDAKIYNADALEATIVGKCDILFLNPPYDFYKVDNENVNVRLETLFIEKYVNTLADGGLLILVLPINEYLLKEMLDRSRTIINRLNMKNEGNLIYMNGDIFRPEEEFEKFKQFWAIFKKGKKDNYMQGSIASFFDRVYMDFFYFNNDKSYTSSSEVFDAVNDIYGQNKPELITLNSNSTMLKIQPISIGGEKVLETIKTTGLTRKKAKELYIDRWIITPKIRPLTELRKGHLAQLLAAGYMNGEMTIDGKKAIIKGSIIRDCNSSIESNEDENRTKETKTFYHKIYINVLFLGEKPELIRIE